MKMKSLLTLMMVGLPSMASAFSIVNGTDAPLTVSVNNICSTANLQPHRETAVSDGEIMNLCGRTKNCTARIYKLENCTGMEIGSFVFNKKAWVQQAPVTHHLDYSVKVIYYMNLVAVGLKH